MVASLKNKHLAWQLQGSSADHFIIWFVVDWNPTNIHQKFFQSGALSRKPLDPAPRSFQERFWGMAMSMESIPLPWCFFVFCCLYLKKCWVLLVAGRALAQSHPFLKHSNCGRWCPENITWKMVYVALNEGFCPSMWDCTRRDPNHHTNNTCIIVVEISL